MQEHIGRLVSGLTGSMLMFKTYCICCFPQTEMRSTRSNAILELFSQLIAEKCFDQLRTQEQLGKSSF